MLLALDLTTRQAARVLAQAVRTHAKLEIDPRPEFLDSPLWGTLESQDDAGMVVNLLGEAPPRVLTGLLGAMCDVRTILSDQLFLFSTAILEATEDASPPRLCLAEPEAIQVANRRRYSRKAPADPVPVRITVPGAGRPFVASISNLSRSGLGCRALRKELEELLLVGEQVQLEFVLPWSHQVYTFNSAICSKTTCRDQTYMLVGLEFAGDTAAAKANLELLRVTLDNETDRLLELGGES